MTLCFFVTDLHGRTDRYFKLLTAIEQESPALVFIGGDLLPNPFKRVSETETGYEEFVTGFLYDQFSQLRHRMGHRYPRVLLILGNDDPRSDEGTFVEFAGQGLWEYLHMQKTECAGHPIYGYAMVTPTPFRLKDWERYDVSRFVEPGGISPEEGFRTVPVSVEEIRHSTIQKDLLTLTDDDDLSRAVFLFHSPPYRTLLDRAALDDKMVDHAPLDVHIGSVAIRRFIESRQPLLTMHGHVHESARITGHWRDRIGRTIMLGGAHDGSELSLIRFMLEDPSGADRQLI